jgi:membrane protein
MGAIFKETLAEWCNDNVPRLGASLAFYTLLSLAPLLVVIVGVAALVFGEKAAQGQLFWQLQGVVGMERARAMQDLIRGASKPGTGAVATVLSLAMLSLGASSVMVELTDALNTIWHVPAPQGRSRLASVIGFAKERFRSVGLVLGVGFLLLVSLILNAWIAAMGVFVGSFLPASPWALQAGTSLVSFAAVALIFAAIYKIVPNVPLAWADVIMGASVTAFLFELGKGGIGLYLGTLTLGSMYGAAGSLVMLFVWVYYSAQLFFLGAEFTKVYTRSRIASGKRSRVGFFDLRRAPRTDTQPALPPPVDSGR